MDTKIVCSVIDFVEAVLAIGGLLIVTLIIVLLFQRERAREFAAVVRRAVKRDESQ
jgi:hypothetical protein